MACPECSDSGWVFRTDSAGYSFAARCACIVRRQHTEPPKEAPSSAAYISAADMILANCRGASKLKRAVSAWLLEKIATADELERFRKHAMENMTEWTGLAGLRLLLENLRDNVRAEADKADREKRLEHWRALAAADPGDYEPLKLEAPIRKPMAKPIEQPTPVGIRYTEADLKPEIEAANAVTAEERERKAAELERDVRERMKAKSA